MKLGITGSGFWGNRLPLITHIMSRENRLLIILKVLLVLGLEKYRVLRRCTPLSFLPSHLLLCGVDKLRIDGDHILRLILERIAPTVDGARRMT